MKFDLITVKVFELFFIVLPRSTEEIFALFISLAFTVDAISSVIKGNSKEINIVLVKDCLKHTLGDISKLLYVI